MDSFFEKLHVNNWNKTPKLLRAEALLLLERHYAQLQGRITCGFEESKKWVIIPLVIINKEKYI
ncbi:hypothetical protein EDD58_103235 [Hazenella coriacea]|uniref:Uncharacterized protein n=1 Tax=Hazenella coriacea TaxID=1179467 RepID=A0A4R3L556_9BACL|nr:hypothetical protein EDD58_103235 [Hazenella coriacea]